MIEKVTYLTTVWLIVVEMVLKPVLQPKHLYSQNSGLLRTRFQIRSTKKYTPSAVFAYKQRFKVLLTYTSVQMLFNWRHKRLKTLTTAFGDAMGVKSIIVWIRRHFHSDTSIIYTSYIIIEPILSKTCAMQLTRDS